MLRSKLHASYIDQQALDSGQINNTALATAESGKTNDVLDRSDDGDDSDGDTDDDPTIVTQSHRH